MLDLQPIYYVNQIFIIFHKFFFKTDRHQSHATRSLRAKFQNHAFLIMECALGLNHTGRTRSINVTVTLCTTELLPVSN